jgi:hypothetical protein
MIAQLILTALLFGVLLYAWSEYRRSPVIGNLSFLAALAGLDFVWVPSHATRLAEWAGVGRGVDLIIYIWVMISWILLLNLHLKIRAQLELITALARTIAISNALQALNDDVRSKPTQIPNSAGDLAALRSRCREDDARS